MKHLLSLLISTSILLGLQAAPFTGKVRYEVSITGEGVAGSEAMLPKAYVVSYGKNHVKVVTEGGLMASMTGDIITDMSTQTVYMVNHTNKTVNVMKEDGAKDQASNAGTSVKKLKDKSVILGYNTVKYEVESTEGNQTMRSFVWTTKEIEPVAKAKSVGFMRLPQDKVEGFTLKFETEIKMAGISIAMSMTASEITPMEFDADYFKIPENYKKEDGPPAFMRMGME
jgi:hypothetical protein